MKLTKGKIIAAVAVIAVLAGAFWYGGNAPGLQGWTVQEQESSAVLEAAPPASGPEESIAPIVTPGGEAESPPPTVSGSPVPSETPQETDALAPSPTPGGLDARPGGAEGGMTAREKVEAAAELAGGSSAGVEKGDKAYSEATGIHMEFEDTPMYNSAYIEGINNLYEFDCGELSGWMYKVNGWFPNYGCSRYQLKEGDVIEWVYTCDLGVDVGGFYSTGE